MLAGHRHQSIHRSCADGDSRGEKEEMERGREQRRSAASATYAKESKAEKTNPSTKLMDRWVWMGPNSYPNGIVRVAAVAGGRRRRRRPAGRWHSCRAL